MAKKSPSQADLDNRSRQLDPEHDAYWQSRGLPGRPEVDVPLPVENQTGRTSK
jgi:hypothetical protein